ncbi:YvrJ family protein [Sedimentibacter sp.]|nr:YvrJ family protein [Sedimentibacter sp.]
MEDILNLIANFGFPIAVAAYLLVRVEAKLNQLSESICELTTAIKSMK